MKLPKDMPFVILDRNMYLDKPSLRLTEDFIEWLVKDCASIAARTDAPFTELAILDRYGMWKEKE